MQLSHVSWFSLPNRFGDLPFFVDCDIDVDIHHEIIFRLIQVCMNPSSRAHIPVLLDEILTIFKKDDEYQMRVLLDATLGAGGHAAALLQAHNEIEHFIGGDRDLLALEIAREYLTRNELLSERSNLWHCNFSQIPEQLNGSNILCDAALVDLGVSTMQLTSPTRGFSLKGDAPLDMRMNQEEGPTAADILNKVSRRELEILLREGEVREFRQVAAAIHHARHSQPIQTTAQLIKIATPHLRARRKVHSATLLFQALRIAVNQELKGLGESLQNLARCLAKGGRIVVISFHSLEDRIVKFAFKALCQTGEFRSITAKPLTPGPLERRKNRRSRSAKLRALVRLANNGNST